MICLAACSRQELPVDQVAERFWRAVVAGSAEKTRLYVKRADREKLENSGELLPIESFSFGRILIDGDVASIETQLVFGGDTPLEMTIDTAMIREDQTWRVDYASTLNRFSQHSELAQVIEQIEQLGDSIKDGVNQSITEFQSMVPAIEQELGRIEQEIQQHLPALREQLEKFTRDLEQSLQQPPREEASPDQASPDQAIAL